METQRRQQNRKTVDASPKVDRLGFVIVLKRWTEDRFRWPRRETAAVTLSTEQLHWILDGIDIDPMARRPVRQYQIAGSCRMCGSGMPAAIAIAPGSIRLLSFAPMPVQPFPGSIATASTLAFALVHKHADGTPLYRLAQAFERAGVPISRGAALGHWVISSSESHLSRIYDALKLRLRSQALILGDETTVQT
ncbi:transposase IS66 (plasmid) [Rhizobium grahamii CCGE 502]|uniref:Transposase IS66 n=1 Tax=Rhizobium grahamii CCGE 502 TaxID=990285 RepID=S3H5S6_9HYPH|nr:transposase IS66 [Rhizobium grahamii CCGE 502]